MIQDRAAIAAEGQSLWRDSPSQGTVPQLARFDGDP
jgi:hypothetical protein